MFIRLNVHLIEILLLKVLSQINNRIIYSKFWYLNIIDNNSIIKFTESYFGQ